jgi:hypothetical protein
LQQKNLIYSYISDENVFFAITFSLSFMLGAPCALVGLFGQQVSMPPSAAPPLVGKGFIVVPWQHPWTPFAKSLRLDS